MVKRYDAKKLTYRCLTLHIQTTESTIQFITALRERISRRNWNAFHSDSFAFFFSLAVEGLPDLHALTATVNVCQDT